MRLRSPAGPGLVWPITCLIALSGLSACATVGHAEVRNEDVPLERGRIEVPQQHGASAWVSQEGTVLIVTAVRTCDIREDVTTRRTSRRDRVNASPTVDWIFGGLGAAAIVTGAVLYVDSSNVHPADESSREYNPVGPDNARLAGGALIVAGAALASVAVVDVVRTSGEEQETSVVDLPGETVGRGVPCKRHLLPGAPVALVLPDTKAPIPIGRTDATGKLVVPLEDVLPKDVSVGTTGESVVLVAGVKAGTISLAALAGPFEDAAWRSLYKEGCSNPQSVDACEPVEDFLRRYPEGKRAQEARLLLAEAAPALQRQRDEKAWKGVDTTACSDPKDPLSVERACSVVRRYLDDFPKGEHADAARAALKKGEPLVAKQRRRLEQEAAREAAEGERRQKDEERRQKAEERKEKAEAEKAARKLRECVRRKCGAVCKVKCWNQSCRDGCNELCISSDQLVYMCEGAE